MTNITALCDSIIAEAENVKKLSERVEGMLENGDGENAELLDDVRIDAVNALSKLCVGLSKAFYETADNGKEGVDEDPDVK